MSIPSTAEQIKQAEQAMAARIEDLRANPDRIANIMAILMETYAGGVQMSENEAVVKARAIYVLVKGWK